MNEEAVKAVGNWLFDRTDVLLIMSRNNVLYAFKLRLTEKIKLENRRNTCCLYNFLFDTYQTLVILTAVKYKFVFTSFCSIIETIVK